MKAVIIAFTDKNRDPNLPSNEVDHSSSLCHAHICGCTCEHEFKFKYKYTQQSLLHHELFVSTHPGKFVDIAVFVIFILNKLKLWNWKTSDLSHHL